MLASIGLPVVLVSRLKGDTNSCRMCKEEELSMGRRAGRKRFELTVGVRFGELGLLALEVELMVDNGGREAEGLKSEAMLNGGGGGDLVDELCHSFEGRRSLS